MFSTTHKKLQYLLVATLILVMVLANVASFVQPASAHEDGAYSHDSERKTSNPVWMSQLPASTRLSRLSLPGTHESMALHGGDIPKAQTLSLSDQLESGIRVLDIRIRHMQNWFFIYHGITSQDASFSTDVMEPVLAFLQAHPTETVLMRIKEEQDCNDLEFICGPADNTLGLSFEQTFAGFQNIYGLDNFWIAPCIKRNTPAVCTTQDDYNPRLSDIRGKIVVLDNFSEVPGGRGTVTRYGLGYPGRDCIPPACQGVQNWDIQDDYKLDTNWDLYHKWEEVKGQLDSANRNDFLDRVYINYLSGSGGSFPYFVASGHSSPGTGAPRLATGRTTPGWSSWEDFPRVDCFIGICTIAFEGTNILTRDHIQNVILNSGIRRVGIVMSDFPGPSLIDTIIHVNFYDQTPPTASPTQAPAANGAGWNNSDVTVSWNWTDNAGGSGIDHANCTTNNVSSSEGNITLSAICKDLTGNTGNASYTIKVDKTAPTIGAAATTSPNVAGWYNGNVTVHFTCADALSGVSAGGCPADQVLSTEGAAVSSAAPTVTDAAGNTSAASNVVIVKIDKTMPTISIASPQANKAYTHTVIVNIAWSASDALSGMASQSATLDGNPVTNGQSVDLFFQSLGAHTVVVNATDQAGNTTSASVLFSVKADAASLSAAVDRALTLGWITDPGIAKSLNSKLDAIKSSIARGQFSTAKNQLNAFLSELDAQRGKAISLQAYDLLKTDALYVFDSLP